MYLNDENFIEMVKRLFDVLPSLAVNDTAYGLSDKEKFILTKQPVSFKLNIKENDRLPEGGASQKAIATRQRQVMRYPKEAFGFPIIAYAVPLINKDTGNVVGSITFAVSQEKENNVIEMSKELQEFSEQLSSSSQQLASDSEELASNSQDFSINVESIQKQIKGMDNILEYIKDVANTTNLLGLNAAIEAARAGEQGKGFAVVAGEIRKLAQNSKESTEKIAATLTKIRDDISKMIDKVDSFTEIGEDQAAQTQQISIGAQKLNELASSLIKIAQELQ